MKRPARSPPTRDRLAGLAATARQSMQQALAQINHAAPQRAAATLASVLAVAPEHPEALRLLALARYKMGQPREAVPLLRRALLGWPDDAVLLSTLGGLLGNLGETEEALDVLARACAAQPPLAAAWFNRGRLQSAQADVGPARDALRRAVELEPGHVPARILLAGALATLGDTAAAAGEYRRAIAYEPGAAQAWLGLVNLKTVHLDAGESQQLARLHASASPNEAERIASGFALGAVREEEGRYAEAFDLLVAANAAVRRRLPWDAAGFSREVDAIAAAFAQGSRTSTTNDELGGEVIFIVSLPRSGSTLTEQILAAHPEVEGASELPDLEAVIEEESRRRAMRFPAWVGTTTPADWQRLGQRYLERTRRWRSDRPRFTDKMPDNWRYAGALLAMLPAARIVNCTRDPLETSWSCFKQLFGPGRQAHSYDLADLGAYWRDYTRLTRHWSALQPARFRNFSYESLLADSSAAVHSLLAFCDL
ncbi:MAG: sulfotransferase, partial [Dokdonella sp.]